MALLLLGGRDPGPARRAARARYAAGAIALAAILSWVPARAAGAGSLPGPKDGTWSKLAPPSIEYDQAAFVDPTDGRFTLARARFERDSWKFDPTAGRWDRTEIEGDVPGLTAFYGPYLDRARRRLIALGFNGRFGPLGFEPDTVQVWALPLEGERRWSRLSTRGTPPRGRYAPNVTIDEAGGRLWFVGGTDEISNDEVYRLIPWGDTWTLDLADGPTWSTLATDGPGLPGAYDGQAVFDATQRTLVVFGARDSLGTQREDLQVWALPVDGARQWRSLGRTPEWLTYVGRMLPDPVGGGLLSFDSGSSSSDTPGLRMHRLDVSGAGIWTSTAFPVDDGTPAFDVSRARLAVDPTSGRLFMAGGEGTWADVGATPQFHRHCDVWSLDLATTGPWVRHYSSLDPSTMSWYAPVVLDEEAGRILALPMYELPNAPYYFALGLGDSPSWSSPALTGTAPPRSRTAALALFDPEGRRVLVYGGTNDGYELGDLWELSFAAAPPRWRRILQSTETPRPRHSATWVLDRARRRAILFGGYAGEAMQDTWELDLGGADPAWRRLDLRGALPPARWDHSAIYDSRRDAIVVFGGRGTAGYLQDTWSLSLAPGDGWLPVPIEGSSPVSRSGHAAAYDPIGDRMVLLWGRDQSGTRFDSHALEFGTPARWADYLPAGEGPTPATGAVAHYDAAGDRLLLFGERGTIGSAVQVIAFDRPGAGPPPYPTGGPAFHLLGVGPNPSRGEVSITFEVPRPTMVRLRLHDVRGRVVRDLGEREYLPGPHVLRWDGRGDDGARVRDGVYFARIDVAGQVVTGKLVVMD